MPKMLNKYKYSWECPRIAPSRLDKQEIWERYVECLEAQELTSNVEGSDIKTKKEKLYISGPMTGFPNYNYDAFYAAEDRLRLLYPLLDIINPAKFFEGNQALARKVYLRKDIEELLECQSIYMLKKWSQSAGAKLEHNIANELGLNIFYE